MQRRASRASFRRTPGIRGSKETSVMRKWLVRTITVCVLARLCLIAAPAWAQASASGIAGTVRDSSGAVLPGVTVEASSPVLIERVRTAITDAQGNYSLTELRPG